MPSFADRLLVGAPRLRCESCGHTILLALAPVAASGVSTCPKCGAKDSFKEVTKQAARQKSLRRFLIILGISLVVLAVAWEWFEKH
jgi:DNA-directed RNA polymerase subunit RPC12/RpoP